MTLQRSLGIDVPIFQSPMAGVQDSALAVAVCNAGGLGSLPCAMLTRDALQQELSAIRDQTRGPFNVNFFCHAQPTPDPEREAAWRAALSRYYAELAVDASSIPNRGGRAPFSVETADVLAQFKPAVVSFH